MTTPINNTHPSSHLFLSVVVIGRNEGSRLIRCLDSVKKMNFPYGTYELIYVDSSSTDGSILAAQACGARVIKIQPDKPSAAPARNIGWHNAKGEYILFLDGDTLLEPNFVLNALPFFNDKKVAVVCGHRRELYPEGSVYNRVLDIDWIFPTGTVDFCGGDAIMRRSALEAVKGYDSELIGGEEPEMCRRMREKGFIIIRLDQMMTLHDLNMHHFRQYWRRAFRTGYAYAEVSQRFKNTKDPFWYRESIHNLWKGGLMLLLIVLAIASFAGGSLYPLLAVAILFAVMILRTGWKTRSRSNNWTTCLLYGCHAHFQHIPIFFGQIAFFLDKMNGKTNRLIDYKKHS